MGIAKEASLADGRSDLKALFFCFRMLGRLKPWVMPVLQDDQGVPYLDATAQAEALQLHLAKLMRGFVVGGETELPRAGLAAGACQQLPFPR